MPDRQTIFDQPIQLAYQRYTRKEGDGDEEGKARIVVIQSPLLHERGYTGGDEDCIKLVRICE